MNKKLFKAISSTFLISYIFAIPAAFIFGKIISRAVLSIQSLNFELKDGLGFALLSFYIYLIVGFIVYTFLFFLLIKNKRVELLKENINISNIRVGLWYVLSLILGFFCLSFVIPIVLSIGR